MGRIETARADISWRKRPDPLDGERLAVCILQQSVELACRNIVGGNEAGGLGVSGIGKWSDQQVMTKTREVERSQSHTPRHIQPGAGFETPQKLATRAEDIDIAQAWTGGWQLLTGRIQHIGHDNVIANGRHVEWHVAVR